MPPVPSVVLLEPDMSTTAVAVFNLVLNPDWKYLNTLLHWRGIEYAPRRRSAEIRGRMQRVDGTTSSWRWLHHVMAARGLPEKRSVPRLAQWCCGRFVGCEPCGANALRPSALHGPPLVTSRRPSARGRVAMEILVKKNIGFHCFISGTPDPFHVGCLTLRI